MAYSLVSLPVGAYEARRRANLGIGHAGLDNGIGYTYFNPQTGNELSAVLGFTYNFENQHTDYQNGVDMHLDWGASKFLTKQWQVGLVGYVYQQISADSGSGNRVGSFESRVIGVGPQLGYVFPIDNKYQGYLNLKGYKEFDADHRAEGWNTWLTFSISAAPAKNHSAGAPPRLASLDAIRDPRRRVRSLLSNPHPCGPRGELARPPLRHRCRPPSGAALAWSHVLNPGL